MRKTLLFQDATDAEIAAFAKELDAMWRKFWQEDLLGKMGNFAKELGGDRLETAFYDLTAKEAVTHDPNCPSCQAMVDFGFKPEEAHHQHVESQAKKAATNE